MIIMPIIVLKKTILFSTDFNKSQTKIKINNNRKEAISKLIRASQHWNILCVVLCWCEIKPVLKEMSPGI